MWMRELRRMVANLAVNSNDVKLRSSADIPATPDGIYLPLIQCTACRTTGWLSRLVKTSSKLSTKLDEIYNTWFAARPEATRLYAASSFQRRHRHLLIFHKVKKGASVTLLLGRERQQLQFGKERVLSTI
jgi:DEAD/DEAH box helicase domain-containing protein